MSPFSVWLKISKPYTEGPGKVFNQTWYGNLIISRFSGLEITKFWKDYRTGHGTH